MIDLRPSAYPCVLCVEGRLKTQSTQRYAEAEEKN